MAKKKTSSPKKKTAAKPKKTASKPKAPAAPAAKKAGLKVVSFALYGRHPRYINGAVENAKLMPAFYPGWELRFYVGISAHPTTVARLKALGANVIMVGVEDHRLPPWEGKFWRMRPFYDPEVAVAVVRDVDSRPSEREAAAVAEWLDSGKGVHIMRDHRLHTSPIMGGMWGARAGFMPNFEQALTVWIRGMESGKHRTANWCKGGRSDQGFLGNIVWPTAQDNFLAHDDRHTARYTAVSEYADKHTVPFKTPPAKEGYFVGQVFDHNSKPVFHYG